MVFRSQRIAVLLIFLAVTGVDCKPNTRVENDWVVGEVDSMTGTEATFGISTHQGLQLGFSEINNAGGIQGQKLKLVAIDLQGQAQEGGRGIVKLVREKAIAIFTGAASSHVLAMAPIAQKNKTLFIATSATNVKITQEGDFIFRTCFIDPFQGEVMAKFALNQLKINRIGILKDIKSDHSTELTKVFMKIFKDGGGDVVLEQSYSGGDIDFRSQLTALRSKDLQAIFIPGYYTDVSLIARQTRELGMKTVLLGADGWDSPKLKEIGGKALSGSYFSTFYSPEDPSPKVKTFVSNFLNTFGVSPDGVAAMAYEATQVFAYGLRKSKEAGVFDLRKALGLAKIEVMTGEIQFDADRNVVRPAVIMKIDEKGEGHFWKTVQP